jgi:nicotinamidase-related amidase
VYPLDDVIDRTARLADAFRGRGWHVVHVTVPNALGRKALKQGRTLGGRKEGGYTCASSVSPRSSSPA